MTAALVRAFDIDAGMWTAVVDPPSTLIQVCTHTHTHTHTHTITQHSTFFHTGSDASRGMCRAARQ